MQRIGLVKKKSKKEMCRYTNKDHTFVICAYKESPYIEECLASIMNQKILGQIIIATSTPNDYIMHLAQKYNIKMYVNEQGGEIAKDWNFAISVVKTKLATIAHQDDIYQPDYLTSILENINRSYKPLIAFSDYGERRQEEIVYDSKLLKVKKRMLFLLRIKFLQNSIWVRRRILSIGSAICCPSVTMVLENLTQPVFVDGFKSNLDWEAWEKISRKRGSFVYCNKPLMLHRIHEASTTSEIIGDNIRIEEDYYMFCKFWPKWIAKILLCFYKEAEKSNKL